MVSLAARDRVENMEKRWRTSELVPKARQPIITRNPRVPSEHLPISFWLTPPLSVNFLKGLTQVIHLSYQIFLVLLRHRHACRVRRRLTHGSEAFGFQQQRCPKGTIGVREPRSPQFLLCSSLRRKANGVCLAGASPVARRRFGAQGRHLVSTAPRGGWTAGFLSMATSACIWPSTNFYAAVGSLLTGFDSRIEELESKLARYEKEGNVIPTGLPAGISRMSS